MRSCLENLQIFALPLHFSSALALCAGLLLFFGVARALWGARQFIPRIVGLFLILASVSLWVGPFRAADLRLVPDSAEYAIGGSNFVREGYYGIRLSGERYPSRYLPFFSVSVAAPAYLVGPDEIGNAIIPIFLLALAALAAAWALGEQLFAGGGIGGFLALLFTPLFVQLARQILTEIPTCACVLANALLFFELARRSASVSSALAAAVTLGMACSFRPVTAILVLPWLFARHVDLPVKALMSGAIAAVGMLSLLYQHYVFGHWFYTGYHFWVPEHYETLRATFDLKFLAPNMEVLLSKTVFLPGVLLLIGLLIIESRLRRAVPIIWRYCTYVSPAVVVFALVHALYFFASARFWFLPTALVLIPSGAFASGTCLSCSSQKLCNLSVTALIIAAALLFPRDAPVRKTVIDELKMSSTPGTIIISGINPAQLEHELNPAGTLTILPFSRRVEYASKTPAALALTPNSSARLSVFPRTAIERLLELEHELRAGKRVLVETEFESALERSIIGARFNGALISPHVEELIVKTDPLSLGEAHGL